MPDSETKGQPTKELTPRKMRKRELNNQSKKNQSNPNSQNQMSKRTDVTIEDKIEVSPMEGHLKKML